jgi:hypothetical protein
MIERELFGFARHEAGFAELLVESGGIGEQRVKTLAQVG